nr:hypothetical protein CFP56_10016 [Quercus suber]
MEGSSTATTTGTSALLSTFQQGAVRDSVPPISSHLARTSPPTKISKEIPSLPSMSARGQQPTSSDVWAGAIARCQQQVVYNTSLLESHRRQMHDMDQAIGRLHADFNHAVGVINDFRVELREVRRRPLANEPSFKHDSGDLDVLANQIAVITSKANEVEGLKMQLELMKNRVKRMEEQSPFPTQKPEISSTSGREQPYLDTHQTAHQHPQHSHQALPPMRPTSTSSRDERAPTHHLPQPLAPSQGSSTYPTSDPRQYPIEPPRTQTSHDSYRQPEPSLPPPTTLSGWRPAEASLQLRPQTGSVPAPTKGVLSPMLLRSDALETDRQTVSWASVNLPSKRPLDDRRHSPNESLHASGSPKRTKLAPIVSQGTDGDEAFSAHRQTPLANLTPDQRPHVRSEAPSDDSGHGPRALPAQAPADTNVYRFVPSSQHREAQESWRSAAEHRPVQPPVESVRGRGRGGRHRGRPRLGGVVSHHEEYVGSRPEDGIWGNGQVPMNGHVNPIYHPHSPSEHGGIMRQRTNAVGGQAGQDHLPRPPSSDYYPPTPVHGVQTPFQLEGGSSKKSRTKPVRNSEGILIRKDGRPDMRSVSSANNLRKVHAKKEAERADTDGPTPPSAVADDSYSPEDNDHGHSRSDGTPAPMHNDPDHHRTDEESEQMRVASKNKTRDLMNRVFPRGYDGAGRQGEREMTLGYSPGSVRPKTEARDPDDSIHEPPGNVSSTLQDARPTSERQTPRPQEARSTAVPENTEA